MTKGIKNQIKYILKEMDYESSLKVIRALEPDSKETRESIREDCKKALKLACKHECAKIGWFFARRNKEEGMLSVELVTTGVAAFPENA